MTKRIIDGSTPAGQQYPLQPKHINTKDRFWDAFGNSETEVSALYIVRLCQENNGWMPFTKEEIDKFSKHDFHFNRLRAYNNEPHSFVQLRDGRYHVTHEFIAICFKSSPAQGLIPTEEVATQ